MIALDCAAAEFYVKILTTTQNLKEISGKIRSSKEQAEYLAELLINILLSLLKMVWMKMIGKDGNI